MMFYGKTVVTVSSSFLTEKSPGIKGPADFVHHTFHVMILFVKTTNQSFDYYEN